MRLDTNTKAAYEHIQQGTAFDRTFEDTIGNTGIVLQEIPTQIGTVPPNITGIANSVLEKISSSTQRIQQTIDTIPVFASHVEKQFNDLASNMGIFSSSQGLENALANKSSGCSSMHSFFGSITRDGPAAIDKILQLKDEIITKIEHFKTIASDLPNQILLTKQEIVSQIQNEISSTVNDPIKIADLQQISTDINTNFLNEAADYRNEIIDLLETKLSEERFGNILNIAKNMKNLDIDLIGTSNSIHGIAGDIELNGAKLLDMKISETSNMEGSIQKLISLGNASNIKSLFKSDPCIQTLMGYVGTDNFLKNLK